jgi:DNA-binding transcriptional ArsR family regulator
MTRFDGEAALRALADPRRRRMLALAWDRERSPSELASSCELSRPATSQHLRVLREAGLVEVRQEAQRRVYSVRPQPLTEVNDWLSRYLMLWDQRLDALHTEIARGKRERRSSR